MIIVPLPIMIRPSPILDNCICKPWPVVNEFLCLDAVSKEYLLEKRPLVGFEKLTHHVMILICAIFTLMLLPWSLIFAVKRVRPNEQLVVYRLGRVQSPARRAGFTWVLSIVDHCKRIRTKQNSLAISATQVNCIFIDRVAKMFVL